MRAPPEGRKTLRMRGYDYSLSGPYFITICVEGRLPGLGHVDASGVVLTAAGTMVNQTWSTVPTVQPEAVLDEWVVMPDHFHAVLWLNPGRGTSTLPGVVGRFKAYTSHLHRRIESADPRSPSTLRLWQRSFFDRVIRDEQELDAVRHYIRNNPRRYWTRRAIPRTEVPGLMTP